MTAPRCRSCRAPILWATSATTGRLMPIDADPSPAGNLRLDVDLLGDPSVAYLDPEAARRAAADGEALYVAHFATCEQADRWRQP